jgi:hypothetical protein
MQITSQQGSEWRHWLLTTSIPLAQVGAEGQVMAFGSGTMIDHEGRRFLVTAGHVAKLDSSGWAIVVQQHPDKGLEYYKPRAFVHVGEFSRLDPSLRLLDLCVAQVVPDLRTWYEDRNPRGLFDKRPHQVFDAGEFGIPERKQIYGFSGRVRTERHGREVFASEMTVFPGLAYERTEVEEHHFGLPVPHPGHDAFQGASGSPMCDFSRRLVGVVTGGDIPANTVRSVAIERVLPALHFLRGNAVSSNPSSGRAFGAPLKPNIGLQEHHD